MTNDPLTLLVLADAHYAMAADGVTWPPSRCCDRGCELLGAAIDRARAAVRIDVIVLLGDMLNDGTTDRAARDLADVCRVISVSAGDLPVLAVPGNHDGSPDRLMVAFECSPGVHEIGGYRFVTFADGYDESDVCTRTDAGLALVDRLGRDGGRPVVAIQHNPMNPEIPFAGYPFMMTNRDAIMDGYSRAGVLLSLSGHYHPGQAASVDRGVTYFTAPGLCEGEHPYSLVTLRGREVDIRTEVLEPSAGDTP